jgi:hypothetical protein
VRTSKQWRVQGGDAKAELNMNVSGVAFDEVVVGEWLHIEATGKDDYYMRLGEMRLWFWVDKKGVVHVTGVEGEECLVGKGWKAEPAAKQGSK